MIKGGTPSWTILELPSKNRSHGRLEAWTTRLAPAAFDGYNANMTTKELIRKLLDQLPDDATIEDVQYQIFVLQKIQAGEEDLEAGRIVTNDQVMQDLARWVK
jgi:hypothetical protein